MLFAGSVKTELPLTGYHTGEKIPGIALTDSEGNSCTLSDYKGKKVVVSFWATYHAQSRANNVQLHNYLEKFDPEVAFVSIALDENRNVVERTLELDRLENKSQFYETKGTGSGANKDFNPGKRFCSYLIDESGVIMATHVTPGDLKTIL